MRFLGLIVLIYGGWLLVALAVQRRIVFPRNMTFPASRPGAGFPPLERHWLSTKQGEVESWFVPGRGRSTEDPGAAVVFAHGNAELIDSQLELARRYHDLGVSLLLVEYRGYSRSAGTPSQQNIVHDFDQAVGWLMRQPAVDPSRIVYHGRSLGTGVVCSLAERRPPAALILQAPFRSVRGFVVRYAVPPPLVLDPFDNERVLKNFDGPVLIFHGTEDTIIPVEHGRKLARVARRPRLVELPAGHNDFPIDGEAHWDAIERLFDSI